MDGLNPEQQRRYGRQLGLPEIGEAGQRRLLDARVLIVGAGGLGSPVILYLAAAGVGCLGVADGDDVDLSNLQRQVLHDTPGVGHAKASSAGERVKALNPDVTVIRFAQRMDAGNVQAAVRGHDVVVDCTDNFHTRYLLNDACVIERRPLVHGSVFEYEGQASTFTPGDGPCYRCLFPAPPPPDLSGGNGPMVLGPVPGLIGMIQAAEVVKLILGVGVTLSGRLLLYDALRMRFHELELKRDPACPACGDEPQILNIDPDRAEYQA